MANDDKVFQLFANCIPVRGATKSIVCDLQRMDYYEIPNDFYALLTEHAGKPLADVKAAFDAADHEAIEAAFDMLAENELGVWLDRDAGNFSPLDLSYERPETINNAVIDVGPGSSHDFAALFGQLDELGCNHVELRLFTPATLVALDEMLAPSAHTRLRAIQLVIEYAGWSDTELAALCDKHPRISHVFVYGAPAPCVVKPDNKRVITYVCQANVTADDCGRIHPGYFVTNTAMFAEAQQFNTCLNQKLGIDADGNIKNCPSLARSYGDARTVPLATVVRKDDFRRLWRIKRDDVEVCRDCEYRYICTDCRAHLSDPDNPLSKPAGCAYDPYTGQWAA